MYPFLIFFEDSKIYPFLLILIPYSVYDIDYDIVIQMGIRVDSGPTNGQNKRMAKFEVNGQIFKFSKTANGHGHSPNRQNSNRRMASQNFFFS